MQRRNKRERENEVGLHTREAKNNYHQPVSRSKWMRKKEVQGDGKEKHEKEKEVSLNIREATNDLTSV